LRIIHSPIKYLWSEHKREGYDLASRINNYFGKRGLHYDKPVVPDLVERLCGILALVLLGFATAAVLKGRPYWDNIPWQIWVHLGLLGIILLITPVMMWRRRGDRLHRQLGWVWAICMFTTATISLDIRIINRGSFSFIHLLSILTIIGVPMLIIAARRHDIALHRRRARGFVIGALLIAGFFTFPFNRLLGGWLFGTLHG
jgi:uncharacterized membrane protein